MEGHRVARGPALGRHRVGGADGHVGGRRRGEADGLGSLADGDRLLYLSGHEIVRVAGLVRVDDARAHADEAHRRSRHGARRHRAEGHRVARGPACGRHRVGGAHGRVGGRRRSEGDGLRSLADDEAEGPRAGVIVGVAVTAGDRVDAGCERGGRAYRPGSADHDISGIRRGDLAVADGPGGVRHSEAVTAVAGTVGDDRRDLAALGEGDGDLHESPRVAEVGTVALSPEQDDVPRDLVVSHGGAVPSRGAGGRESAASRLCR